MKGVSIVSLIKELGGKQYRHLVEAHMRKLGNNLPSHIAVTVATFSPEEKKVSEGIIDLFNVMGHSENFWLQDAGVVLESVQSFMTRAMKPIPPEDAAVFNLFQLVTMNFALAARSQRELRRFIGIRSGLSDYLT